MRGLRDVHGLVADALEIAIDARRQPAESAGRRPWCLQSEQALDALVDLDLHLVDGVFFAEHGFRELLFGIEHGVNGLMDGAFREAAHPQQPLLQFFEIAFEMAFHVFLAASVLPMPTDSNRGLQPPQATHPNRPVI